MKYYFVVEVEAEDVKSAIDAYNDSVFDFPTSIFLNSINDESRKLVIPGAWEE